MAIQAMQVYKCPVCDTTVEVLDGCGVELVCCGPPMVLLTEKVSGGGCDPHAAVFDWTDDGLRVRIGQPLHPCSEDHHIAWIELLADGCCLRQSLTPWAAPEATFHTQSRRIRARYYCTQHGLWSSSASLVGIRPREESVAVAGSAV